MTGESGVPTQHTKHMALNLNFASVFTIENMKSIFESAPPARGIKPLKIGIIQELELEMYFHELENSKSTGPDDLFLQLPKELKQQLLQSLISISNQ